jgi:hypothetical protein
MLETLTGTLKRAAAAFEAEGVPYLLAGGLGCWARGGPPSSNDIDFFLRPEDAERALDALRGAGMRPEKPPEQWLYKAWADDILIDLIFEPVGMEVTDEVLQRGERLNVDGMEVCVMALDDIVVTKLLALDERTADFSGLIQIARALREQIDWASVRERSSASPFARAFFAIVDGLDIAPAGQPAGTSGSGSVLSM